MDLLLWITIGLVVLIFMKKSMESKVAFIKANREDERNLLKAKLVIWWIGSATAWGIVSIFLVIWCFEHYIG